MREPVAPRYLLALIIALAFGALVYLYNPVDHLKADFVADTQGIRISLDFAVEAVEQVCKVSLPGIR
jgi:hypothetical protein